MTCKLFYDFNNINIGHVHSQKIYFPTMPHDELYETAKISNVGRLYSKEHFLLLTCCIATDLLYCYLTACRNGHPYAVGEVCEHYC